MHRFDSGYPNALVSVRCLSDGNTLHALDSARMTKWVLMLRQPILCCDSIPMFLYYFALCLHHIIINLTIVPGTEISNRIGFNAALSLF
jgi:uncharacterized membrane protein YhaH (DUF805 family)